LFINILITRGQSPHPQPAASRSGICGYPATNFNLLRIFSNFQIKLTKIRLKLSKGKLKQNLSLKKFKIADRAPVGANKKGTLEGFPYLKITIYNY
jgi:hypothetical protein